MLSSFIAVAIGSEKLPYYMLPAGKEYAVVNPGGKTILPNGRFLTPKGERFWVGADLWGIALNPRKDEMVAMATGTSPKINGKPSFTVLSGMSVGKPTSRQVPIDEVGTAATYSPNGKLCFVSTGDKGGFVAFNTDDWSVFQTKNLADDQLKDAYINEFRTSRDGAFLYAVDVARQSLYTFDAQTLQLLHQASAGREPYTVELSSDGSRLFVANIGMFDYSLIPDSTEKGTLKNALNRPPFGFPSKNAEFGVQIEGRFVPGVGSAYAPDAQSVWSYAITDPSSPRVTKKEKSGLLIHSVADGGKAVGGSAPNAMVTFAGRLYVANANNDSISVFEEQTLKLKQTIRLRAPGALKNYRGIIPSGMAMSSDGKRLYVCESGLNAIAVVEPKSGLTLGHIPTGWFPMQIKIQNNHLLIATQKGLGRGPRGASHPRPKSDERYGLTDMPGMVNRVKIPDAKTLKAWTQEVYANNGLLPQPVPKTPNPVPYLPGKPSKDIEYVVFITKENHTFDGIFGEIKGAKGFPDYAEFGMNGWIAEKGKSERLPIMPNHIRLAQQFSISDNFYMEPQASGDGHRWLNGVYPSLWTTRVFYSGWDFRTNPEAKGRFPSMGSNGSIIPEDYLENGSLWEHLHRNGISFRNYGEGYELPGTDEPFPVSRTGTTYPVNHPMPKVLFDNTDFNFPAYNNNIPDIARADWFIEDLNNYRKTHQGKIPKFLNIAICNDHGSSANPKQGYPYVCSFMADNDLALGRIVEFLSQQPEWKKMAIFVTQDDSGGDSDHIDRHRSFVLTLGPWAKKGYVSNDHTSIMSIIRTIYLIFGIGPNNMYDAVATPLHDMFTTKPDYRPYRHQTVDPRVFRPEETFDPSDPEFKRRRKMPSTKMDDPQFIKWLEERNKSGN